MINSSTSSSKSLAPEASKSSRAPSASPSKPKRAWYHKFLKQPEEPGKEKWRDASLSDKERWKEWHKAKDREQRAGYGYIAAETYDIITNNLQLNN